MSKRFSYRRFGKQHGLKGKKLDVFTSYMYTRTKELGKDPGYVLQWVNRFKAGYETVYDLSDRVGQRVLTYNMKKHKVK